MVTVDQDDGGGTAFGYLVFDAIAPLAPTVVLSPPGPFAPDDPVTVSLAGMVPGATAVVGFCGDECSSQVDVRADDEGRGRR